MSYSSDQLLLIGGIPSSGSTRLVKVLSESPRFFCLPETGLFTKGYQLNRTREYISGNVNSEVNWIDVCAKAQQSLGILLSKSDIQNEKFCPKDYLIDYFSPAVIGKVIVEKTPENVFAFDYYLSASKEHKVIVTTRDVRGICASLLKRGLSFLDAMLIWYSHAYEAWRLTKNYPQQVLHLPYHVIAKQAEIIPEMVIKFFKLNDEKYDGFIPNCKSPLQEREVEFSLNMSAKTLETRSWDSRIRDSSQSCLTEFDIGFMNESLINSFAFSAIDQSVPMSAIHLENVISEKNTNRNSERDFQVYNYTDEPAASMIEQLRANYKSYTKCYR